jgi:F-type H+-transporting ATPase subunit c
MTEAAWAFISAGIGAVGSVFAGAFGISRIAKASVESIARQPEAANDIRGVMIITAAMIEGVSLLALVICFLLSFK